MPEAVSKWINTRNIGAVDRTLKEIADSYMLDFMKYAVWLVCGITRI